MSGRGPADGLPTMMGYPSSEEREHGREWFQPPSSASSSSPSYSEKRVSWFHFLKLDDFIALVFFKFLQCISFSFALTGAEEDVSTPRWLSSSHALSTGHSRLRRETWLLLPDDCLSNTRQTLSSSAIITSPAQARARRSSQPQASALAPSPSPSATTSPVARRSIPASSPEMLRKLLLLLYLFYRRPRSQAGSSSPPFSSSASSSSAASPASQSPASASQNGAPSQASSPRSPQQSGRTSSTSTRPLQNLSCESLSPLCAVFRCGVPLT